MSLDQFDLPDDDQPKPDADGLRKFAEKMQSEAKKAAAERDALLAEKRTGTVRELFRSKGLNEKVSTFYPSSADVSAEAVDKWLQEHTGVFTPATDSSDGKPTETTSATAALQDAMRAVQDATPVSGTVKSLEQEAAEIDRLKMTSQSDRDQLDAWNKKLQGMARELVRGRYGADNT